MSITAFALAVMVAPTIGSAVRSSNAPCDHVVLSRRSSGGTTRQAYPSSPSQSLSSLLTSETVLHDNIHLVRVLCAVSRILRVLHAECESTLRQTCKVLTRAINCC